MTQLVTANQFQLVPEVSRLATGFQQGQQIRGQFDLRKQQQAEAEAAAQTQDLTGKALAGDKQALTTLGSLNMDQQKKVYDHLRSMNKAERDEDMRENEVLTRTSLDALTLRDDPVKMRSFLQQKRADFIADGRNTARIDKALSGDDASLIQAAEFQAREGQTVAKLYEQAFAGEDPKAKGEIFDNETKLRNEFEKLSKPFETQAQAFGRIQAAADQPDGAGDLALVFSFMKVLDPGSTVREGEYASARNADGVPGRVQSLYNSLISGESLNPEQRSNFVDRAKKLYKQAEKQHKTVVNRYSSLADRNGLSPDNVIRNVGGGLPAEKAATTETADDILKEFGVQ